jgi:hypothetical protein
MSDLITEALKYIEKPKPKPPTLWDKIKGLYFAWKMRKYTKAIRAQVGAEKDPKYMMTEQERLAYEAKQNIQVLLDAPVQTLEHTLSRDEVRKLLLGDIEKVQIKGPLDKGDYEYFNGDEDKLQIKPSPGVKFNEWEKD